MKQNERTYLCKSCGCKIDRDVNAAINIEKAGLEGNDLVPAERRDVKLVEMRASTIDLKSNQSQVQSVKQETQTSLVSG